MSTSRIASCSPTVVESIFTQAPGGLLFRSKLEGAFAFGSARRTPSPYLTHGADNYYKPLGLVL